MAKKTVSHRLDEALIARADAYAEVRGSTRSVLIEEGLVLLLDVAEGGVPDLPEAEPVAKPRAATSQAGTSSLLGQRHAALAKQMGWVK